MSAKRILVIDDNRMLATTVANILEKAGYQTTAILNGGDGIDKAQEWTPDLIVLDVVMPNMNGYEVASQLKQNQITADIPIIFLSARGNTDEAEEGSLLSLQEINQAFEIGASDFLPKPVAASELLKAVERVLSFHDFMIVSTETGTYGNDTDR